MPVSQAPSPQAPTLSGFVQPFPEMGPETLQSKPSQSSVAASPAASEPETRAEEFPDMTKFRRDSSSQAPSEPTPIIPMTLPVIPEPGTYVPPELSPSEAASSMTAASSTSAFNQYGPGSAPPAAGDLEPARSTTVPQTPETQVKSKRSSSKLLGDDLEEEPYDSGFQRPQSFGGPSYAPSQGSSPLPKMMGGVAILMALGKLPLLLTLLPLIGNPQYTWSVIDIAVTTIALMALGLAMLMSKN